jgi:hypothetical protein
VITVRRALSSLPLLVPYSVWVTLTLAHRVMAIFLSLSFSTSLVGRETDILLLENDCN